MKKNLSRVVLFGCVALAAQMISVAPVHANPPAGNFTPTPTFEDDFTGGTVQNTGTYITDTKTNYNTPILKTDQQTWRLGLVSGPLSHGGTMEPWAARPENVSVVPGTGLQLTMKVTSGTVYYEDPWGGNWSYNGSGFPLSSGEVTTCQSFQQLYGYFEANIILPKGPGGASSGAAFWPAFWLVPDRGNASGSDYYRYTQGNNYTPYWTNTPTSVASWGNEIDVLEAFSDWQSTTAPYVSQATSTLHYDYANGTPSSFHNVTDPEDVSHAYGVYWAPNQISFYVDGVDVFDTPHDSRVGSAPSFMIIDFAAWINDWSNNISLAQTESWCPATMTVSKVRAWQGRITPPATNRLLGAIVTSSTNDDNSVVSNTYIPFCYGYLVDGFESGNGISNGWRSAAHTTANNPESVTLDMGATFPINNVTLFPRTDTAHAGYPTNFVISTSTDNVHFTPQYTAQNVNLTSVGTTGQTYLFTSSVNARYVSVAATTLSADENSSSYRMSFSEIEANNNAVLLPTLSSVSTVDPFTSVGGVTYNFYNGWHTGGTASPSDIGTMSAGVWSPSVSGGNTDHFVDNNAAMQLVNVGDSISMALWDPVAGDNPAIGLVLSAGLVPSGSVAQSELVLQRFTDGYTIANYTGHNGQTTAQTGYATMTITETAYNSSSQQRTFSVKVVGGGINPPLTTTATLTGANCYIGLAAFGNPNGMQGASAKNFLIIPGSVPATPDLAVNQSSWVSSSNESLPLWSQSLLVDGILNSSALGNGWQSALTSPNQDHSEQVTIDLGAIVPVSNITLWPRTDHPGQSFPVNFAVKTSPDNSTWSTQEYITNNSVPGAAGQSYSFGVTSARYINVLGINLRADPQDSGAFRLSFAEITATGTPANLALNKTVTASSNYTTSPWGLADVVDGQLYSGGSSNGWLSNNTTASNHTEWVKVDLGASQTFTTVTLYPRTDQLGQSFPVNFTIQTSATGTAGSWSTPVTRTAFPAPLCTGATFGEAFVIPTTTARYIMVTGTSLSKNPSDNTYRMGFAEITVN